MNRQPAAQVQLSPLHVQQGLLAVLALLVTLVGVQLFQQLSPGVGQPSRVPGHAVQQSHFSAVAAQASERATFHLTPVDQAQVPADLPRQERWVF